MNKILIVDDEREITDLVEIYSTLIFSGLSFFRKVAKFANESNQRCKKIATST